MSTTVNLGITKLDAGVRQPELVINDAFDAFDAAIVSGTALASWTPTWVNLTTTSATITAKFKKIGRMVFCRVHVLFGASTSISGAVSVSLPLTAAAHAGTIGVPIGLCRFFDTSGSVTNEGTVLFGSTTTAFLSVGNSAGTYVVATVLSSTVPFTWATGDEITMQFCYEAA